MLSEGIEGEREEIGGPGSILGLIGQHLRRSPRSLECRTGWSLDLTPNLRCRLVTDQVVDIRLLCYILFHVHHGKDDEKKSHGGSGPRGVVRCFRKDRWIDGRQCGTCSRWSNLRRSQKFRVDVQCVVGDLMEKMVE